MNLSTKKSFQTIAIAGKRYEAAVAASLKQYAEEREKARKASEVYKDAEQHFSVSEAALKSNAREEIRKAETAFTESVKDELKALRKEYAVHMMTVPSSTFINTLSLYRDFSVTPGRSEISALVEMCGGSTLGLRCINETLKKTGSDYRLDFPSSEMFEEDLAAIEKLAAGDLLFTPVEWHSAAVSIYGGMPIVRHRDDGSTFESGQTINNISLITSRAAFESRMKALADMENRWTNGIIPSIATKKTCYKKDDEGQEAYEADKRATIDAAEIKRTKDGVVIDRSAENARTAEIISHYTK